MRVAVVSSLLLVAGCGGGGGKPADTENSLASLEPSGSSSQDMPPPPESTASPHPAAAASAATAPASAPAAHAVVHPTPSANGTIEGKSFSPKLALVAGAMQKDGRILISLTEGSDCVAPGDTAQPGTASLTVTVPYKDGMKADLSAMKRPNGKTAGEIAFSRVS
ncbi:MAG TPA: hypothetical protein VN848_10215, partial [Gemmatimonadales bacterium]|nr:hypothetical protein [Gemmatimonadales bacterium]